MAASDAKTNKSSLKAYLGLKSGMETELIETARKQAAKFDDDAVSHALPLPDTYLVVNGTNFRTNLAHYFTKVNTREAYKAVDYAVLSSTVCQLSEDDVVTTVPELPESVGSIS